MSAHTPGPWRVFPPTAERPSRATVAAHEGQVTIFDAPLTDETAANARLIAAAPDMGRLLLSAYQHVSHGGPTRAEVEDVLRKAGLIR